MRNGRLIRAQTTRNECVYSLKILFNYSTKYDAMTEKHEKEGGSVFAS